MRRLALLCLAFAACDTPSPHFKGIAPTTVAVDGSTFDIRVKDELAEALRTNAQYAPRFGPIRARAAFAMARVSGCSVKRISGDQALAIGELDCNGAEPPALRAIPPSYNCLNIQQWEGLIYTEFDCDPVPY